MRGLDWLIKLHKARFCTFNIYPLTCRQRLMTDYVLLLTTWPDQSGAQQAAEKWLNKKLVACVNILPRMQSLYVWDGKLNSGHEHQILLKTRATRVQQLEQEILSMHPYECPEILHIPITGGYDGYLNWIKGNTE